METQDPLLPERYYHVFNRGNNRENIFLESSNYTYFMDLYLKYIHQIADLFAYCLHTQLHPAISFLHEPGARRFSLSLDIAEVFKPFIVDRLIFKLLNQGSLKKSDFDEKLNFCYLNESCSVSPYLRNNFSRYIDKTKRPAI